MRRPVGSSVGSSPLDCRSGRSRALPRRPRLWPRQRDPGGRRGRSPRESDQAHQGETRGGMAEREKEKELKEEVVETKGDQNQAKKKKKKRDSDFSLSTSSSFDSSGKNKTRQKKTKTGLPRPQEAGARPPRPHGRRRRGRALPGRRGALGDHALQSGLGRRRGGEGGRGCGREEADEGDGAPLWRGDRAVGLRERAVKKAREIFLLMYTSARKRKKESEFSSVGNSRGDFFC